MTENKVNWEEATRMLLKGHNFAAIADHFGVTLQYIQSHYMSDHRGHRQNKAEQNIIFPGIRQWFIDNKQTYAGVGRKIFPEDTQINATQKIRNFLVGNISRVDIEFLFKLSEVTGMTVDDMFRNKETREGGEA